MRLNIKPFYTETTHEGAPAARLTPTQQLRRSVLSCLLWEKGFYEDGQDIAERIVTLARQRPPAEVAALAIEARSKFHLRHVPLLLLAVLERTGSGSSLVSETMAATLQRADEPAEFLCVLAYVNGVSPDKLKGKLSAQVKKGLAQTIGQYDGYQLGKYDRAGGVRLRDILRLCRPKPRDDGQAALWKQLIDGTLPSPDTWEVSLSRGADKKETFERLLRERKLGYLALLRNVRGMLEAGVDETLITEAILARRGADRVLPFRYVAAARTAPRLEPVIDQALSEAISALPKLDGKTVVLVDVSGSMARRLSAKSDMTRMDAAATLASIIPGNRRVFSFSNVIVEVPPRWGMAGIDAIITSQHHSGTLLGEAVHAINSNVEHDRLIVITDEQSYSPVPAPIASKAYMINVAPYQNGVGFGQWVRIDGWSEQVLRFIVEHESAGIN